MKLETSIRWGLARPRAGTILALGLLLGACTGIPIQQGPQLSGPECPARQVLVCRVDRPTLVERRPTIAQRDCRCDGLL